MEMKLFFPGATTLQYREIGTIQSGQDGSIYGDYLFRFNAKGICSVYTTDNWEHISTFEVDKNNLISPHSNAVCFGTNYYRDSDEFPLIYTNVYNNYAKCEDRREGTCCVYRIQRNGNNFSSELVQVIRIDFVNDSQYWCSPAVQDIRPYGNFIIDTDVNALYAFVMRDEAHQTRFFKFDLPNHMEGIVDDELGVKVISLKLEDIQTQFDSAYTNYMQGAACYDGYIYSIEGFDASAEKPARLRVFNLDKQEEVMEINLAELGLTREPEFIDVYQNKLIYSDNKGALYYLGFC